MYSVSAFWMLSAAGLVLHSLCVCGVTAKEQEYGSPTNLNFPMRTRAGQFAMAVRVPLLVVAYVVVPKEETSFAVFMLLALLVGLPSMAGVAVNRPILADVVRPNHKATVFALVSSVF